MRLHYLTFVIILLTSLNINSSNVPIEILTNSNSTSITAKECLVKSALIFESVIADSGVDGQLIDSIINGTVSYMSKLFHIFRIQKIMS